MKKCVRRVMAAVLATAMTILSMGNMSVAQAAEGAALNINERVFLSGAGPVDNADGSITFKGQDTMKSSFALPETLVAGDSIKVNVKLQFNSDADTAVRFYLIANATDSNIATEIQVIPNEGTGTVVEKTFNLTAAADATELLFASSSYGVNIDDVTIYEIYLGDKPAAAPEATDDSVALNIGERVFLSGAGPVDNADGSITFKGQDTMKSSFALPETLVAGDTLNFNVKLKFNSDADTAVRFYLISNATDSNIATEIQIIPNEGTGTVVEKSFALTAVADATELLFASSSYGVNIDDVTIYSISLGDEATEAPKTEEPKAEEPKTEEPKTEEPKTEQPIVVTAGEYVVKSGDTLGKIAAAYGLTVKELASANNIANADLIRTGAKLSIPSIDTSKRHIVVSGDTLGKIAKKYGCTVAALVKANNIENADLIKTGQLIVLP